MKEPITIELETERKRYKKRKANHVRCIYELSSVASFLVEPMFRRAGGGGCSVRCRSCFPVCSRARRNPDCSRDHCKSQYRALPFLRSRNHCHFGSDARGSPGCNCRSLLRPRKRCCRSQQQCWTGCSRHRHQCNLPPRTHHQCSST